MYQGKIKRVPQLANLKIYNVHSLHSYLAEVAHHANGVHVFYVI